ncbi:MAG: glutamine amidotransferase, partial [Planctomycetes bacterium]|nr:glutamine amidotransferase [Planctomycetota bacterium]
MGSGIELGRPLFLLLLLLAPLSWWWFRRARGGRLSWPDRLAVVLRTVLLAALSLALAEPRWVRTVEGRATAFVQDVSDSLPAASREEGARWVERALLDRRPEKEDVAHLVFADGTGIERPFQGLGGLRPEDIRPLDPRRVGSVIERGESDAAAALRAAVASFPPEAARRVVLLTDGNETRGRAEDAVRDMVAAGVEVLVLPLRYEKRNEVLVRKVVAPPRARTGQPVAARAVVESTEDGVKAEVVFRDGEDREIARSAVTLDRGTRVFEVRRTLDRAGLHEVRVQVEGAAGDGDPANNRGTAAVWAEGETAVLLVSREPEATAPLASALERSGMSVRLADLSGLPEQPGALLPYECLVLVDVAASDLSAAQMRMIRSAVEETGLGLVAVGGPHSFSAGAYGGTPLEEVLPVTMDVKQKRVLPNGACVVVLHTCEFPRGNDWARTIAKSVVRTLGRNDWFGCVDWEGGVGPTWVVPLSKGDRGAMLAAIDGSNPMDMPSLADCIESAVAALEKANAHLKHMIVISDGDPAMPGPALVKRMVDGGITISAVAIAQHGVQDAMRPMTQATGGRYYALEEGQVENLPAIFMKEASVVRRSTVFEKEFAPIPAFPHEVLKGILPDPLPPLHGYVVTSIKDRAEMVLTEAENSDPILAIWRKGLGVSAAFTSDLAGRWGRDWLGWDRYERFAAQLVRACARGIQRSPFSLRVDHQGGEGLAVVEAVDGDGNYVDGLAFEGRVLGPSGEPEPLRVLQTAPGRYEAVFPSTRPGVYFVSLEHSLPGGTAEEPLRAQVRAAMPVDYSPEHLSLRSDAAFFERLAAAGAKVLEPSARPFLDPLPKSRARIDAWRWLLLLAVLLFPLEVAARRLRLDPGPLARQVVESLARLRGRLPAPRPARREAPPVVTSGA